ncbi:hypothetical protein DP939_05185 [Spongiactinospora rosea]|uniref:Mce-associated membrane protein n=1 Tax=Spongiactinospora rosea TaxID=2248750 RepID=A0A366M781_9ACTN|nr:hypothetical protein [Spongiactinospora rosea]RBQ22056.1 hypothetical protein DP939_05185 [Spongiactinospora rosea]
MRAAVIGALAAVVVALGLVAGLHTRWLADEQAAAAEREAVMRAAGAHAVNLLSVSHDSVEEDIRRVLNSSTGPARDAYEAGVTKLRQTTVADKVVQIGVLRSVGLVSLSGDEARALVVADGVIQWEGREAAPRERFHRWTMDLTKTGGSWLVSRWEEVP